MNFAITSEHIKGLPVNKWHWIKLEYSKLDNGEPAMDLTVEDVDTGKKGTVAVDPESFISQSPLSFSPFVFKGALEYFNNPPKDPLFDLR